MAGQAPGGAAAKPTAPVKPAAAAPAKGVTPTSPGAGPVVVVETDKGVFEFETYPNEAPKTVAQILALIKRNFYNGQRVHRYEPGFVVQFGDQQTRDMTKRANWGTAGSGKPIGVGEMNPKRTHRLGAVAMAHQPDDPASADSQMYIVLGEARARTLNGKYTVFGQVISGMSVVQKMTLLTNIKRVSVRAETPAK